MDPRLIEWGYAFFVSDIWATVIAMYLAFLVVWVISLLRRRSDTSRGER